MIGDGDTLFSMSWNPNMDTDTIGYDIFIDPPLVPGPSSTRALFRPRRHSIARMQVRPSHRR